MSRWILALGGLAACADPSVPREGVWEMTALERSATDDDCTELSEGEPLRTVPHTADLVEVSVVDGYLLITPHVYAEILEVSPDGTFGDLTEGILTNEGGTTTSPWWIVTSETVAGRFQDREAIELTIDWASTCHGSCERWTSSCTEAYVGAAEWVRHPPSR